MEVMSRMRLLDCVREDVFDKRFLTFFTPYFDDFKPFMDDLRVAIFYHFNGDVKPLPDLGSTQSTTRASTSQQTTTKLMDGGRVPISYATATSILEDALAHIAEPGLPFDNLPTSKCWYVQNLASADSSKQGQVHHNGKRKRASSFDSAP
jgi:hypothetical protein